MKEVAAVDDFLPADIFLYYIEIVDVSLIDELARRSVGKYSITVRLLRYNCHICYASTINLLFKAYRCPSCDQFINGAGNLERHLNFRNV